MITIDGISLRLGGHLVLNGASASLPPKAHIGLVGRNGAGKSSLLKLIAGLYEADGGSIEAPSGTRIGYLAQEAPGGKATPFETVLAADEERARLMAEAEQKHDPHRIGEALVSTLDEKGQPSMVELTLVKPPNARVGPITPAERKAVINASPVRGQYDETEDRDSAYEILNKRTAKRVEAEAAQSDDGAPQRRKTGSASRSDSFWTTLGKTIVRTGVPMATRVLENVLKNRTKKGGGF